MFGTPAFDVHLMREDGTDGRSSPNMILILKTHLRKLVGDASGAAAADYYCFSLWREREREKVRTEEARWRKSDSVCAFPLLLLLQPQPAQRPLSVVMAVDFLGVDFEIR